MNKRIKYFLAKNELAPHCNFLAGGRKENGVQECVKLKDHFQGFLFRIYDRDGVNDPFLFLFCFVFSFVFCFSFRKYFFFTLFFSSYLFLFVISDSERSIFFIFFLFTSCSMSSSVMIHFFFSLAFRRKLRPPFSVC